MQCGETDATRCVRERVMLELTQPMVDAERAGDGYWVVRGTVVYPDKWYPPCAAVW